jgi:hypothetical protein
VAHYKLFSKTKGHLAYQLLPWSTLLLPVLVVGEQGEAAVVVLVVISQQQGLLFPLVFQLL